MSGARTSLRRAAKMTNATSSLKRENVPEESKEKSKEEKPKTKPAKRLNMNLIKDKDYDKHEELGHEYEELREKNIRERQELFNQLGFVSLKQGLKKQRQKRVIKKKEILPPRKSSRIQKIDATRPPLPDLSLSDLLHKSKKGVQLHAMQDFLTTVSQSLDKIDSGTSFLGDVADQLGALKLPPGNVTNVVPSQVCSMAVHPTTEKLLVAAGSTGQRPGWVGLWDVNNNEALNNGVQLFKIHKSKVNCMTFNPFQCEELWTTSYDGTVRCFDLNKQAVRFLYVDPEIQLQDTHAYHSQMDASTFMLTMGIAGHVMVVDTRTPNTSKPSQIIQVSQNNSNNGIKTVSVHPTKKHLFVCPGWRLQYGQGREGVCKLFDIRSAKLRGQEKAVQEILSYEGHTKPLTSAMISPVAGTSLVTASTDNQLRIFETESGCLKKSLSHNNQTGSLRAEWHPRRDDLFFVGSEQSTQINALTDVGEELPAIRAKLLQSVCSVVKCHPSQNVVVGGNSSGMVHVLV